MFVTLIPCKLFDACFRALSLADANELAGSSCICSIMIYDSNPFSKTTIFSLSQAKICADFVGGAVRAASVCSLVKRLLIWRAY